MDKIKIKPLQRLFFKIAYNQLNEILQKFDAKNQIQVKDNENKITYCQRDTLEKYILDGLLQLSKANMLKDDTAVTTINVKMTSKDRIKVSYLESGTPFEYNDELYIRGDYHCNRGYYCIGNCDFINLQTGEITNYPEDTLVKKCSVSIKKEE